MHGYVRATVCLLILIFSFCFSLSAGYDMFSLLFFAQSFTAITASNLDLIQLHKLKVGFLRHCVFEVSWFKQTRIRFLVSFFLYKSWFQSKHEVPESSRQIKSMKHVIMHENLNFVTTVYVTSVSTRGQHPTRIHLKVLVQTVPCNIFTSAWCVSSVMGEE